MSAEQIPPEVSREIAEFLTHVEANPHGPWPAETDRLWRIYDQWRDIIRREGLLDNTGTSKALPGLSSWGRLFLLEHPPEPEGKIVWQHSEQSYSADGRTPIVLSREEASVLAEFMQADAALDTRALERSVGNVSRVMKQLAQKFPGAVRKPRGKGEGYYIRVRQAPTA
jgi:hypothetical protein